MDSFWKEMDNIGRNDRTQLLSQQVTGARYFFLRLAPRAGEKLAPALGGRELCNPDYTLDRESYAYDGLEYVAEGEGSVTLGDNDYALRPGSVFTYGRTMRCRIRTDPAKPLVKYFVCLAGAGAGKRLAQAGLKAGDMRVLATHADVRGLFDELIHEGQRTGPLVQVLCATRLELLLLKTQEHVLQAAKANDPSRERFLRCKAIIDERAAGMMTLEEVAAAAGLEVSSVCRLFRRYHDQSPYQYLLRRKMTLAAEHLVENGGLVKEAAQRTGFSDPYHFSRCFKAVHGVSPKALLRYRSSV